MPNKRHIETHDGSERRATALARMIARLLVPTFQPAFAEHCPDAEPAL
jgi:hypothetical protein